MPWRYQPVIVKDESGFGDDTFCLCEVHFEKDSDQLRSWTRGGIAPSAESMVELTGDLAHMIVDAFAWAPVRYEDMKAGMTFERVLTKEQREKIARMVENVSLASNPTVQ